jgi:hypothetical protein
MFPPNSLPADGERVAQRTGIKVQAQPLWPEQHPRSSQRP